MGYRSFLLQNQWQWRSMVLVLLFLMAGCRVGRQMAAEGGFLAVEEIKERNARAAQARIDLKPRSDAERSNIENGALKVVNRTGDDNHEEIKEAFCGSPPDLSHLPSEFFSFQLSAYIPEDTPAKCRAAVDRKFPGLESCYLVFENGSTGYANCYIDPLSKDVTCMSPKALIWEVLWNEEMRKDCPDIGDTDGVSS